MAGVLAAGVPQETNGSAAGDAGSHESALEPGTVEESVDYAVNAGILAFNDGRLLEAAQWFRDASAQVETIRGELRRVAVQKKVLEEIP